MHKYLLWTLILCISTLIFLKWYYDPDIQDEPEIIEAQTKLIQEESKRLKVEQKMEDDKKNG